MFEHVKKNEAELNELLSEYWAVRNDAGMISLYSHDAVDAKVHTEIYMETLANKFGITVS